MILNINKGIRYFFFNCRFWIFFSQSEISQFFVRFPAFFFGILQQKRKKNNPPPSLSLSLSSLSLSSLSLSLSLKLEEMQHFVLNVDQNLCLLLCLQSNIQGTLAINWYWLNRSNVENDIYSKVYKIKSKSNLTMKIS